MEGAAEKLRGEGRAAKVAQSRRAGPTKNKELGAPNDSDGLPPGEGERAQR